jgi:hypothetical protein
MSLSAIRHGRKRPRPEIMAAASVSAAGYYRSLMSIWMASVSRGIDWPLAKKR